MKHETTLTNRGICKLSRILANQLPSSASRECIYQHDASIGGRKVNGHRPGDGHEPAHEINNSFGSFHGYSPNDVQTVEFVSVTSGATIRAEQIRVGPVPSGVWEIKFSQDVSGDGQSRGRLSQYFFWLHDLSENCQRNDIATTAIQSLCDWYRNLPENVQIRTDRELLFEVTARIAEKVGLYADWNYLNRPHLAAMIYDALPKWDDIPAATDHQFDEEHPEECSYLSPETLERLRAIQDM